MSDSVLSSRPGESPASRGGRGSFSFLITGLLLIGAVVCSVGLWFALDAVGVPTREPLTVDEANLLVKDFALGDAGFVVAEFTGRDSNLLLRHIPKDGTSPALGAYMTLRFTLVDVERANEPGEILLLKFGDGTPSARLPLRFPLRDMEVDYGSPIPPERTSPPAMNDSAASVAPEPERVLSRGHDAEAGRPLGGAARGLDQPRVFGAAMIIGIEAAKRYVEEPGSRDRLREAIDLLLDHGSAPERAAEPDVAGTRGTSDSTLRDLAKELAMAGSADRVMQALDAVLAQASADESTCDRKRRSLKAGMKIGIELGQGLPGDHTSLARIDSVHEVLIYRVTGPRTNGTFPVTSKSLMTLKGAALVSRGAQVIIEVGQFIDIEEYTILLSVDGGLPFEPVFHWDEKLAIPAELSPRLGLDSSKIAHLRVELPEGTQSFELSVKHDERRSSGSLVSWYYGVDDFGRQVQMKGGYEAVVLWNRPLDWGSIESESTSEEFSLTETSGPESLSDGPYDWGGPVDDLRGFRVKAGADSTRAAVLYTVQYGR